MLVSSRDLPLRHFLPLLSDSGPPGMIALCADFFQSCLRDSRLWNYCMQTCLRLRVIILIVTGWLISMMSGCQPAGISESRPSVGKTSVASDSRPEDFPESRHTGTEGVAGRWPNRTVKRAVPERYRFLYDGGYSNDDAKMIRERLPYSSITLVRTTCYGTCPAYVRTLKADGGAEYDGLEYAPRTGKYLGEIALWDYAKLCEAVERFGLAQQSRAYRASWTDDAAAILRVSLRDRDEVIEIEDYGRQGPAELWAIFSVMDAMESRITWQRDPAPRVNLP